MAETAVSTVTVGELRILLAEPARGWWLVHATDRVQFHEGHIPGALARPADAQLHRLGATARIVVYGEDEHAATAPALAAALRHLGVEVVWFAGGLAAWAAAGLPIDHSG